MTDRHQTSRRTTLKSLGTLGAAVALGGVTTAAQSEPAAKPTQGAASANVVDVAVGRMAKGHS